eukprot:scaffold48_cov311-Pinguiococcus_pyrenoidosus.AAC.27
MRLRGRRPESKSLGGRCGAHDSAVPARVRSQLLAQGALAEEPASVVVVAKAVCEDSLGLASGREAQDAVRIRMAATQGWQLAPPRRIQRVGNPSSALQPTPSWRRGRVPCVGAVCQMGAGRRVAMVCGRRSCALELGGAEDGSSSSSWGGSFVLFRSLMMPP